MGKPFSASRVPLSDVSVRPVRDGSERAQWDRLMDKHHYLGFRCLFGGGVRHVAQLPDGRWVALLGWVSGAFKVKARDAWIGWAPEQQFRRLHLVANNTRFLILPGYNGGNLASRVLSLSLRRLSADFEAQRGHPVLLAETFVDPSRFCGGCYRASNWALLGETRGYARDGGGWTAHGAPKQVYVRALGRGARAALGGLDEPESWGAGRNDPEPPAEDRLCSLYDFLREVPEYRAARGVRHRLATVLAVAVAAKLAGAQGVTAIAEFAGRLTQRQLAAVRAFRSPTAQRLVPPSKTSIHRILSELDPDALDGAVRRFAAGGDYVLTVKANRPSLPEDIRMLDFDSAPARSTVDKGHGRLEERVCAVVPLDAFDEDIAALPGRRQAFRVVRRRTVLANGRRSVEAAYGITSLAPERAGPSGILALNRGHREIENRLHYVRDVSFDEDRSRVRIRRLPRNLACLSNAAISIVRMRGRFRYQPQAQRHYAAHHADALREVLQPAA